MYIYPVTQLESTTSATTKITQGQDIPNIYTLTFATELPSTPKYICTKMYKLYSLNGLENYTRQPQWIGNPTFTSYTASTTLGNLYIQAIQTQWLKKTTCILKL